MVGDDTRNLHALSRNMFAAASVATIGHRRQEHSVGTLWYLPHTHELWRLGTLMALLDARWNFWLRVIELQVLTASATIHMTCKNFWSILLKTRWPLLTSADLWPLTSVDFTLVLLTREIEQHYTYVIGIGL